MRFRYLRDPLFLFCLGLYFLNRWGLKPHLSNTFLHSYLNDVICIPFWIPIMLFILKALHLRKNDNLPTVFEILIPLILWSWFFEAYLPFIPMFKHLATSDYRDVLAYTVGGCLSALIWKFLYQETFVERPIPFLRQVSQSRQRPKLDGTKKNI